MVSFSLTTAEATLIDRIVLRAAVPARRRKALAMDLTATHANGCPLRLADLLDAPDVDFAHDLAGIQRHLNRSTGHLGGCFVPRFAVRDVSAARA